MRDPPSGRVTGLQLLLGLLLLGCVLGIAWRLAAPEPGPASAEAAESVEPGAGESEAARAVAHVRGRILLEVEPEPEEPEEPGEPPEQGDTDGEDPFAVPDTPDVQLEPPSAGTCRVQAWQDGTVVSDPATCDADGEFEVQLQPGVHGPTSFELTVPGRLRAVLVTDVPEGGVGRLPPVALGPGFSLQGQVVDGRGQPLAGVEVQAMPIPNLDEPVPWRVQRQADGTFAFETLPPGPVSLRAVAPGHAAGVTEAIVRADDVLLVLDALLDLKGRVMARPALLEHTRVRLEGSGVWPPRVEQVDPDNGSFRFEQVPDGVYAVEAIAELPERDQAYASIPLENVTPDLEVSLALIPASRVPVQVLDVEGNPVPQARVSLANSAVGLLAKVATTDEEGRARPGPVVPGPYVLRADADGFLGSDPVEVTVTGQAMPEVQLVLPRPGRIEGVVVDTRRRPVGGAVVEVRSDALFSVGESRARAETFAGALSAAGSLGVTQGPVPEIPKFGDEVAELEQLRTDEQGRFVLDGLTPGTYELQASHGNFATSDVVRVPVAAGMVRTGVELMLRSGHRLTGRVLDDNDQPIARAVVELQDGTAYLTDSRGVFDAGLRRGRQSLIARAPGMTPTRIEVAMAGRDRDVEIILGEAGGVLQGRVTGPNDQPLAQVRVTVQLLDGLWPTEVAFTDERGLWALQDLPVGPGEIEVEALGYLPVTRAVTVDRSTDPVDVSLSTGWVLEVFVREVGRRDPIQGALVSAGSARALTDAEGLAVLEPLAASRVLVEAKAEGFTSASTAVQRPPGDRAEATLELSEGGGMQGVVIDYRGDPVAGAEVMVRARGSAEVLARTRTGAAGQWSVQGLPETDVRVEASPPTDRVDDLAEVALDSDVLRGHVTKDVDLRFDRR